MEKKKENPDRKKKMKHPDFTNSGLEDKGWFNQSEI